MGRRASKIFIRVVLAATLALALLWVHRRMEPTTEERERYGLVPEPGLAKLLALGFDALVSDVFWLQALQVAGGSDINVNKSNSQTAAFTEHFSKLTDVITTLDPWVGTPYRAAAVYLVDSEKSVKKANHFLERSLLYHPNDWRQYFYLGFNAFYYLEDNLRAAEWIEQAARLPGSPAYLARLAAKLRVETGDSLAVAESFLREMYRNAKGEERAQYRRALAEIQTEQLARLLDAAREEFKRRNGRDIRSVEELAIGPNAVLDRLPEEPNGRCWVLHHKTGRIVSAYFATRYELFSKPWQKRNRERRRAKYLGTQGGEG